MRKPRTETVDTVPQKPARASYPGGRNANIAGIMPPVIGVWWGQEGLDLSLVSPAGFEDLLEGSPGPLAPVLVGLLTEAAHTARVLRNLLLRRDRN